MTLTEARTRGRLIDPQLREAGWQPDDRSQVRHEIPVDGYDAEPWNDVTDYCLYDPSGNVLAVVEAKRFSAFSSSDSTANPFAIDTTIVDRLYQHEAIRRLTETFSAGRRRALPVMATGSYEITNRPATYIALFLYLCAFFVGYRGLVRIMCGRGFPWIVDRLHAHCDLYRLGMLRDVCCPRRDDARRNCRRRLAGPPWACRRHRRALPGPSSPLKNSRTSSWVPSHPGSVLPKLDDMFNIACASAP